MEGVAEKSNYEETRERNISRNLAFLKNIGLLDTKSQLQPEKKSNTAVKKKRIWTESADSIEPRRKSSRLSGIGVGTASPSSASAGEITTTPLPRKDRVPSGASHGGEEDHETVKRRISVEELSIFMERENTELFEATSNQMITLTVDRINGMSVRSLNNRISKITVMSKMVVFYYGLQCAGLENLAARAKMILSDFDIIV